MLCGFMELIFEPFGQGNEPDTSADVSLRYFIHCVFIRHETFETRMDSIEKEYIFLRFGIGVYNFHRTLSDFSRAAEIGRGK